MESEGEIVTRGSDVLFSSKSNEHLTPPDLFDKLHAVFNFKLDPCSNSVQKQKDKRLTRWDHEEDVLERSMWLSNTFINPPYSHVDRWVDKTIEEWKSNPGNYYVMLLPSRTDRPWFEKLTQYASAICFIKGRLKFWEICPPLMDDGSDYMQPQKYQAPFPSLIAVFASLYNITIEQYNVLESLGTVWHIRDQVRFYVDNDTGEVKRHFAVPTPGDLKT